jgi:hypothetical protein
MGLWGELHNESLIAFAIKSFLSARISKQAWILSNKKSPLMNQEAFVVDNSIQISNFDFTPRDFEITLQTIYLIQND